MAMPGNTPPVSDRWMVDADQAVSSPSQKIGIATHRSGECEAPWYGLLWMMMSPGSTLPSSRRMNPRM